MAVRRCATTSLSTSTFSRLQYCTQNSPNAGNPYQILSSRPSLPPATMSGLFINSQSMFQRCRFSTEYRKGPASKSMQRKEKPNNQTSDKQTNPSRNDRYTPRDQPSLPQQQIETLLDKGVSQTPDTSTTGPTSNHFFASETTFEQLGITNPKLLEALEKNKITIPAKIQAKAIPLILAGEDVVIGAETGSGKTLAYLLPIIQKLLAEAPPFIGAKTRMPRAIVMLPNKELCMQVQSVVESIVSPTAVPCGLLIHKDGLFKRPDLLICTPVALKAVLDASPQFVPHIKYVIVDEADMMLSGGFYDSVNLIVAGFKKRSRSEKERAKQIKAQLKEESDSEKQKELNDELKRFTQKKQFLFVAATIPEERNNKSAKAFLDIHFTHAKTAEMNLHQTLARVKQDWIPIDDEVEDPYQRLVALLEEKRKETVEEAQTIIFVNSMHSVELTTLMLGKSGISAVTYHGDLNKEKAAANLKEFMEGKAKYLVSTNVLSRGIDFSKVKHIVQFEFALNKIEHLHRIGRTARGGADGFVTNFYTPNDANLVEQIRSADNDSNKHELVFKPNRLRIDLRKKKMWDKKQRHNRPSKRQGATPQDNQEAPHRENKKAEAEEGRNKREKKGDSKHMYKDKRDRRRDKNQEGTAEQKREKTHTKA